MKNSGKKKKDYEVSGGKQRISVMISFHVITTSTDIPHEEAVSEGATNILFMNSWIYRFHVKYKLFGVYVR